MSEVFLCPRGQLDESTRRALKKAGIVPVEVDEPERCSFLRASQVISGDDMTWAALDALCTSRYVGATEQREQLARNLLKVVSKKGGGVHAD